MSAAAAVIIARVREAQDSMAAFLHRRTMLALAAFLASCVGVRPDSVYFEVTRGAGEIDGGGKFDDFDTEEYLFTTGVIVALGEREVRIVRDQYPMPPEPRPRVIEQPPLAAGLVGSSTPSPVAPPQGDDSGIPWLELGGLLLASGALGGGAVKGAQRYKARRLAREQESLLEINAEDC